MPWQRTSRPQLRSNGISDKRQCERYTVAPQWLIVVLTSCGAVKQQDAQCAPPAMSGVKLALSDITVRSASLRETPLGKLLQMLSTDREARERDAMAALATTAVPHERPKATTTTQVMHMAMHWLIVVPMIHGTAERKNSA